MAARARSGAGFEAKLARIAELGRGSPSPECARELRGFLASGPGLVVAGAARAAGELGLAELAPDLLRAYDRLFEDPVKVDPRCAGKVAIVEALMKLDAGGPAPFLRGLRHVQREPAFGGAVDTAPGLRGLSAHALFGRMPQQEALLEVVPLLVDPEPAARAEAAAAIGDGAGVEIEAVLRLKVLAGDAEPEVLSACFKALLKAGRERSIAFVAERLDPARGAEAELAALALGESRLESALPPLRDASGSRDPGLRRAALVGLALGRTAEGTTFLVERLAGDERGALEALTALAVHKYDERLRDRVQRAVEATGKPRLLEAFRRAFEGPGERLERRSREGPGARRRAPPKGGEACSPAGEARPPGREASSFFGRASSSPAEGRPTGGEAPAAASLVCPPASKAGPTTPGACSTPGELVQASGQATEFTDQAFLAAAASVRAGGQRGQPRRQSRGG
ncbi:MAG TPA: hypothetical protein VFS43_13725 [Polyangiaceae bacterium]|nr:hypothetical protein [Polyangiaceae bacterium]